MIVLAPVYQPGARLPEMVADLRAAAPDLHVVVVDDGSSDPAAARAVDAARDLGCTVLRHPTNRGKGVALRTGFRHVAEAHPGQDVVCADFDGQHRVADVLRVAERTRTTGRMVLGVRRLDGEVPLRSRVGNAVTRVLFRAVTGCAVRDTQTGLRAHPADQLDWLLSVSGDHFEYEMAVLLEAARVGLPIEQTTIATHYVKGNSSSHFSSLVDSARVYAPLLRFAVSRLSGSLRTRAATSSAAVRPVVPPEG
ncbi:glycosyltransferase family 2 protein [Micromonospora sp. DT47]|uniref:glycosyltransferase family 2 protein n=1 Tax=Micromonospora sp. DT47 TaxID=3393431 RepID=UPI003CFAB351